ncbi:hypothetical protein GJ496_004651 [Pomphorhynchus laevis]|nr:hypothetical protein GJ496_004651 [Pomphorhynchus laevis]
MQKITTSKGNFAQRIKPLANFIYISTLPVDTYILPWSTTDVCDGLYVKSAGKTSGLLRNGDNIVQINNEDIRNYSFDRAHRLLSASMCSSEQNTSGTTKLAFFRSDVNQYITIELNKEPNGFGFRIYVEETNPKLVLVKEIIQNSPAFNDGRLKVGDCLVSIDAQLITSLQEAVDKLHSYSIDKLAKITVKRLFVENPNKYLLKFRIRLNRTKSAGLGISIKGRKTTRVVQSNGDKKLQSNDHGLYIAGILNGGAAHKDGRLLTGDRIISVNDINIAEIGNNTMAMDKLRKAMLLSSKSDDDIDDGHAVIIVMREPSAQAEDQHGLLKSTIKFPSKLSSDSQVDDVQLKSNDLSHQTNLNNKTVSKKVRRSSILPNSVENQLYMYLPLLQSSGQCSNKKLEVCDEYSLFKKNLPIPAPFVLDNESNSISQQSTDNFLRIHRSKSHENFDNAIEHCLRGKRKKSIWQILSAKLTSSLKKPVNSQKENDNSKQTLCFSSDRDIPFLAEKGIKARSTSYDGMYNPQKYGHLMDTKRIPIVRDVDSYKSSFNLSDKQFKSLKRCPNRRKLGYSNNIDYFNRENAFKDGTLYSDYRPVSFSNVVNSTK